MCTTIYYLHNTENIFSNCSILGNKKSSKAATESFLRLRIDQGYIERSRAFQEVNRKVHEQWSDDNHALDEGKFVRGKKPEGSSSIDSKTGNQWFTFAGGFGEKSAGVVDAFTGN